MSLRLRLVLLVLTLTTSLLGGLGLYVGGSLRAWTVEVVDAELKRRADALVRAVELEHGRIELEGDDEDEAGLGARGWPVRIETLDGRVLHAVGADWGTTALAHEGFTTIDASVGRPLRVWSQPFTPRHARSGERLVLRVGAPLTAYAGLAARFQLGLLVALALAALLGAAGAAALAGVFLAPLRRLSRAVDGIGVTSLERRLDTRGLDPELARLATGFNGVLSRLSDALAAQRAFVGRASHALRTPVACVLSEAEVTLLRERTPEAYRAALTRIGESARDAARVADGLLALTRAEADTGEAPGPVPLDALAAELQRLMGPRAEAAGLAFTAVAPEGQVLWATRGRVRELLDALLDNALRYTPRGGAVRFEASASGGAVVLEVADSGPGIAPDERAHVFERFYRGRAAVSSGQQGSGLGLSVVAALAAAEGARVTLDDAPGGGTRVRVTFARERGAAARGAVDRGVDPGPPPA